MDHKYIFGMSFMAVAMSAVCVIMAAASSDGGAMAFTLVAGPLGIIGVLGSMIATILKSQNDRIRDLEGKLAATVEMAGSDRVSDFSITAHKGSTHHSPLTTHQKTGVPR